MTSTKALPTLEGLPAETLEAILARLQFRDICSLRLVSRIIATNAVQKTLKGYFASKTVDWTSTTQVRELVQLTQPHWMGCFLQNLSIVGTAPALSTLSNKDLLTEAFENLHLNSVHGGLESIVLSVHGRDISGDIIPSEKIRDWKLVWQTASQTFEITCRALADSALHVQKLDMFTGSTRCSLACNKIAPILDYTNVSRALTNLTCVSLSLSHHTEDDSESGTSSSMNYSQRYISDIRHFLELCSHLETLELHWFKLQYKPEQNEAQREESRLFTEIAKLDHLSQLRHCRLYGIETDEAALLAFCKQVTQLCSLTMEEIHLEEGKFASAFSFLTNKLPHLDYIHLNDLYETRHICFDGPGKPSLSSTSRANGPECLTRTGAACQRPIKYRMTKGRLRGSPEVSKWVRRKKLLYGPPDPLL